MRRLRYLLSRFFFIAMGLSVTKWRKEVEALWALPETERLKKVENQLKVNRPLNACGDEVTSLTQLYESPPLSKKALREQRDSKGRSTRHWSFNRHTAGTTGEPTHITVNRIELGRMLGIRDYCFRHYGVKLGEREARLWGRPESGLTSRLKSAVMNRRIFHPVGSHAREEIVSMMEWQPDYIYGYSSLLLEAAKTLADTNFDFLPPKCVVCTAETILPAQKSYISRAFKAPVAEEYGSTEFDVIAFECADGHRHLVNPWLILDEHEGLVSDVSRATQHIIRYQLGDSFSIDKVSCRKIGSIDFIEQLHGRTSDRFFYITEREKIHATVFSKIIDGYTKKSNEAFIFSLVQSKYSELDVFISGVRESDVSDLEVYIEREINRIEGVRVDINVSLFSELKANKKRNYFTQNIIV
ncbi:CoF synthetase [Marinobacter salarius]|uniref:CoF synthetase n=2 Tax=Pseudomonadota TaxID=1224 RepID=UPI001A12924C|nr:CoF synthetase [Marinobacter salarius]HIO03319.1 CoF synthetase [Alphaproteobacteria bacterium]